jgi:glycosyltransferase involved in cell wall biosynthesis
VFLYTERGATAAKRAGAPPERITVLNNTIDSQPVLDAAARLDRAESERHLGLPQFCPGPVGAFIGGLDESKRIDFLLAAADLIRGAVPTFCLVVAGDGVQRQTVEAAAASRSWLRYVGTIDVAGKGAMANVADLLLNPGRVGLIGIDSLAMAVPIVTTDWPLHAPEVDYLEDGRTAVFTGDTVEDFASAVVSLLRDDTLRYRMADACRAERSRFSIDAMAQRFVDGVSTALELAPPTEAWR